MMSGRSAAVYAGSKLLTISGQLELQVTVMIISGLDALKGLPAGVCWSSLPVVSSETFGKHHQQ